MSEVVKPGVPSNALWGGLACGLVTATALAVVFASLSKDQVPGAYDGGDATQGTLLGLVAASVAALVIVRLTRLGRWTRAHALLPPVLLVVVLVSVVSAGGERNRLETGALWAAAAVVLHVLLGQAWRPAARKWFRGGAALGLVVVCVAAYGITSAAQPRWRAQKFAALGLPTYVPDVPGYELTAAYAGRGNIILLLRDDPAHPRTSSRIDVWISRPVPPCYPGVVRRWVQQNEGGPKVLAICLPEGGVMKVGPGYGTPEIDALFPAIVARKVDAATLARYPNGATEREAD